MRVILNSILLVRVLRIYITNLAGISCGESTTNSTDPECDYFTEFKVRLERGGVGCQRCTKCDQSKGEGTVQECFNFTDTICGSCEEGKTYSLEYEDATVCDECKKCEEGQEVLEYCTRFHDVKCGKCLPGYIYDADTGDCVRVKTASLTEGDSNLPDNINTPSTTTTDIATVNEAPNSATDTGQPNWMTSTIATLLALPGIIAIVFTIYSFRKIIRKTQTYSRLKGNKGEDDKTDIQNHRKYVCYDNGTRQLRDDNVDVESGNNLVATNCSSTSVPTDSVKENTDDIQPA